MTATARRYSLRPMRASAALLFLGVLPACTDPFIDRAAREPGATLDPSGLVLRTLTPGNGPRPASEDRVKIAYRAERQDGTPWDDSARHGGPSVFTLSAGIPCWRAGIAAMRPYHRPRRSA